MGDVYDAMKRSEHDDGEQPPQDGGEQTPWSPQGQATPAAPAPQGDTTAVAEEHDTTTATGRLSAAAPLREPQQAPTVEAEDTTGLNGYSAEVVVHHDRGSVITEQYRAIRTQVLARGRTRRVQSHVITSAAPEEGKTVTSINLGITFSELRNQNTLVLEGDMRRPSFHRLFNRRSGTGLVQLLNGESDDVDAAIHPTVYDNLQFLPAGGRDLHSSTEMLSSPRLGEILDYLKTRYDHIFIDSPPVVTVTDACILGQVCDSTMLVVRLHKTAIEAVDRAKRLLRAANCDIAGVVLTHMQYHVPRYLYRYL